MNKTCIYHRADFDGIFCREVAKRALEDTAEFIGWDYGDPVPVVPPEEMLFMLDISVEGLMDHPNLVWIDHHKSAIGKYPAAISGYRLDGVAACRLAHQWFSSNGDLPSKSDFIERRVTEPLAVRLAGEYDIWDKRDPRAELFQHGLRSRELTDEVWDNLLTHGSLVNTLLEQGKSIQYAQTQNNASIIRSAGFTINWEGLCFLACNHARFNSFLFEAGVLPEHDALLGFCYSGSDWKFSLYHAPGKEHHDLSLIAVKHGGGGHRGACGFRLPQIPFLP